MSESKRLTPRVGDRVIVESAQFNDGVTRIGTVLSPGDYATGDEVTVNLDGLGVHYCRPRFLQVVDREPVEWPEGWVKYGDIVIHEPTNVAVNKDELEQLLATGPDMLARWDELVGGDS